MKLVGDLKKRVEEAQTKEEIRDAIKEAGILLDDAELEQVAGGEDKYIDKDSPCKFGNKHNWVYDPARGEYKCSVCYSFCCSKIKRDIF